MYGVYLYSLGLIELHPQVSEASVSRNRSTIIVPAGSARDEGWAAFRNILAEINEASRIFILPNQVSLSISSVIISIAISSGGTPQTNLLLSLFLCADECSKILKPQNVLLGFQMMLERALYLAIVLNLFQGLT